VFFVAIAEAVWGAGAVSGAGPCCVSPGISPAPRWCWRVVSAARQPGAHAPRIRSAAHGIGRVDFAQPLEAQLYDTVRELIDRAPSRSSAT
jgi:hypothetical protein